MGHKSRCQLGEPTVSSFAMGLFSPKLLTVGFMGFKKYSSTLRGIIFIWNLLIALWCGWGAYYIMRPGALEWTEQQIFWTIFLVGLCTFATRFPAYQSWMAGEKVEFFMYFFRGAQFGGAGLSVGFTILLATRLAKAALDYDRPVLHLTIAALTLWIVNSVFVQGFVFAYAFQSPCETAKPSRQRIPRGLGRHVVNMKVRLISSKCEENRKE